MTFAACTWRALGGASLFVACAHPLADIESDAGDTTPAHRGGTSSTAVAGKGGQSNGGVKSAGIGGKAPASAEGGSAGAGGSNGGTGGKSLGGAGAGGKSSGGAGGDSTSGSGGSAPTGSLEVDYKCGNSSATDNQIRASLRIKRLSSGSVALSGLELRYYFTSEVAPPLTIEIYDASMDGSAGYHTVSKDAVKAEVDAEVNTAYLKLTFADAAGMLAAGNALTLDVAVHGPNWTGTFSEADDYSFAPDHTDFAAWDHVTLFDAGELLWGKEP